MTIKSWFLQKNFTQGEAYAINTARSFKIERDTEKAILVKFNTDYGMIKTWLPKSVCVY